MQKLTQHIPRWSYSEGSALSSWLGSIGLGITVGVAYFLVAWLSLALLTKPDGVAVFWPAAGIASGTMIALGAQARLPVAAGVIAATIAANLLGDRNLSAAFVFAMCNAGEAILIGWLIAWYLGPDFSLDSVRRVVGFLLAVGIGVAVSGGGGTAGFALFHSSDTPLLAIWTHWFASDALGTIAVAPLVIGLVRLPYDPPERWELAKGMLTLAALAVVCAIAFGSPDYWYTILPLGLLLPVLLAAHCRPMFAAAASLILGIAVVWTTIFGIGGLDEPTIHFADRVYAARATLVAISICTLVLAALFAERRNNEAELKDRSDRLQLALDGAELGVWSIDAKSGRFETDARDRRIHDYQLEAPPNTVAEARPFIHPEDLPGLDAAFATSMRTGDCCRVEYRLASTVGDPDAGLERWAAVEGTVVRNAAGQPVRWLGVTRDITERKQADEKLQKSERALREVLEALPAAIYVTDASGHITYHNAAAVTLWGVSPKLGESRFCGSWNLYWPDGTPMANDECSMAMALRQKKPIRSAEAIAERPDGTRVPFVAYPTPFFNASGSLTGAVNMLVDISERKQAERTIAERSTQLALAGKVALVGSFAFDLRTETMQISPGYAAIHGLPEETKETRRVDWRARAHTDDLPRLDARLQEAVAGREHEHYCEYRIVRSGGEIRWIESRSVIEYDSDGNTQRIIGSNIDVTERKQAEAVLKESAVSLADALTAGEVIAFAWDAVTGQSRRSDNAALILGYKEEGVAGSGRRDFLRRIHPDDRESFKARIRQLTPEIPSYVATFRFCNPDGRHVWLEETAKGEFDARGQLLCIKGLTRNITERKQFEEKLQRSERETRELLGALPAAIYVTDAAGRIIYANQAAVDLWGATPKLGEDKWCDFTRLYHADGTPMPLEDCPTEIALKHGNVVRGREAMLERTDGIRIAVIPYPTPLRDEAGAIKGVVNMTLDISELRKAERALAERNVQLSLAAKAALVGSYSYEFATDKIQVSAGYAALYGLPEGTMETPRNEWRARLHPEDVIRVEEVRRQALSERQSEYDMEYRIVRPGGEVRWIEARSFVSYDVEGRSQRVVGVNIDITERKRAEDHQRALVAELDHRVKNVLATVSAVAGHTLDASSSMQHFVAAFDGRIRAISSTHQLLSSRRWQGISLSDLVRGQLAPYAKNNNTDISGPEVLLSAEAGQSIALVLHELTTNAAKYGALSTRHGRVSVRWYWPLNGKASDQLTIGWQEIGGPPVKGPSKSGYGTNVITDLVPYELGGTAELTHPSEGVRCRLGIPAKWASVG